MSEIEIQHPLTPPSFEGSRSAGDRFRARVQANVALRHANRADERGRARFRRWDLQRLQGRQSASIPPLLGARAAEHSTDSNDFWPRGRGEEGARRPSVGRPAMSQQKDFILKIRALQRRKDPYLSAHIKSPSPSDVPEDFTVTISKIREELLRPQTQIEPLRPLAQQLLRPPYRCADPVSVPSSSDENTMSYDGDDEGEYSWTPDTSVGDGDDDETYYTAAEIEETYFTASEW